jgi:stage V sporulation protein D (sporulation-specific penicillin-binding protein)
MSSKLKSDKSKTKSKMATASKGTKQKKTVVSKRQGTAAKKSTKTKQSSTAERATANKTVANRSTAKKDAKPVGNKLTARKDRSGRMWFVLAVFVLVLLYVGLYRVYAIKQQSDEYEKAAIYNQVNKVPDTVLSPNRGDIVDRNGEQLAVGETVYNIILDVRLLLKQKEEIQTETIEKINELLDIPLDTLKEYVALDANGKPNKDTSYFMIAKKVPYTTGKAINDLGWNWFYGEQDTKRSYPQGTLAAQVLGFIRGDTIWGLENTYNDQMLGVPGRNFRTYEADGTIETQHESPIKGNKLVTTLDANIQKYAEEVCKTAYDAYSPEYTASIVMNPNTGEVYAMAQYPTFDPNDPMKLSELEKSDVAAEWEKMSDDEKYKLANTAWKNFCLTGTFEPGSIFKPVVAAMALEEGVITTNDSFVCGGSLKVADYEIHCHNRNGHGSLTLTQALAQSCNVAMMRIAAKLGVDNYLAYQSAFGFGEKTGIDLPGEVSASNLLYTKDTMHTAELATSSFGQGFNCTPIQAITAFSSLINGGKLMQPYVVSQVIDDAGNTVKTNSPKVVRNVISQETSDYIRTALEEVLTEGTGKKAMIQGYSIGGKTGTAQQGDRTKQEYTLSFIAYHSVENPDMIMMTIVHKPEGYNDAGGEASAVPMLKQLMEDIINYEAIPPDNDGAESSGTTGQETYTVKDYTNQSLKSVIDELINDGIDFEVIGSGNTVAKQSPAAGTKLEKKASKLLLNISSSGDTNLVPIPDVTGISIEDATKMLESSGFGVSAVTDSSDSDDDVNVTVTVTEDDSTEAEEDVTSDDDATESESTSTPTVYVQMPSANVRVEAGTTVRIRAK